MHGELKKLADSSMAMKLWNGFCGAATVCPGCRITAEILDTDAVCTLSHLMFPKALNETSAVHVAACVVAALEQLHQRSIVFRALAPSTLAVDTNGLA